MDTKVLPPSYDQTVGQTVGQTIDQSNGGSGSTSQPVTSQPISQQIDYARFDNLVRQYELNGVVAGQLKDVLSKCVVVLLCDDSDSMNRPIAEEGTDPFAPKRSTRWLELKKLASNIIEIVTAVNPDGLDIHFLNRPTLEHISAVTGLQNAFGVIPVGGTPLVGKISSIINTYQQKISRSQQLLLIVITDGEPTDGTRNDLFNVLVNKKDNIHISFAECTDQAEDMEYLDAWDGIIKNFDNTDDYREELSRVKNVQGSQFKFDYMDYVVKILLATFVRWYYNLDQVRVYDPRTNGGSNYVQKIFTPSSSPPSSSSSSTPYPNPFAQPSQPSYQPSQSSYQPTPISYTYPVSKGNQQIAMQSPYQPTSLTYTYPTSATNTNTTNMNVGNANQQQMQQQRQGGCCVIL